MAVVSILSAQLTNAYAQPVVFSNPNQAPSNDVNERAVVATGATDSAGSIYRLFRVASNSCIADFQVMNDANTGGTSYKVGVYLVGAPGSTGGAVPVTFADQILASAVSMAAARSVWTSLYFPAILNATGSPANITLRIWELLGLTSDPGGMYDVGIAAVTPGSAGGNIAVQLSYSR